jgi:hypothetical protein
MEYRQLAALLRADKFVNELKKALTHTSFYAKESGTNGNSRYIFAGMYAFKGEVAGILYRYVPAKGTQLQHALGNMFKNEALEKIFEQYHLKGLIRCGANFNADAHRHIFVYGMLGFLHVHAGEEAKLAFIRRNFILPNTHLFANKTQRYNLLSQCEMLSGMIFGHKTKFEMICGSDGKWTSTLSVKDTVLASETSVSHRYSRSKTLKRALINLSELLQAAHEQQPGYTERKQIADGIAQQKIDAAKAGKRTAYEKKQAEKAGLRQQKKIEREKQSVLQDKKRRDAKAAAKLRKQQQQEQAAKKASAMTNMSADKRRRLQDRGWL